MEIRPAKFDDLRFLADVDATIESTQYLYLDVVGEGMIRSFSLQQRPLREKHVQRNPVTDGLSFSFKQVASGIEDGVALVAEHEQGLVGTLLAILRPERSAMEIVDIRVDSDHRRQGLATAMVYQVIQTSRNLELSAVTAESRTNNFPACQMLQKLGFQLSGVDCRKHTNHDLVSESATLLWHAVLED